MRALAYSPCGREVAALCEDVCSNRCVHVVNVKSCAPCVPALEGGARAVFYLPPRWFWIVAAKVRLKIVTYGLRYSAGPLHELDFEYDLRQFHDPAAGPVRIMPEFKGSWRPWHGYGRTPGGQVGPGGRVLPWASGARRGLAGEYIT